VPAAAVIPALGASVCVVAVKKRVVGQTASYKGAVSCRALSWNEGLGTGEGQRYSTARGENR
jgi:hypothetical protein